MLKNKSWRSYAKVKQLLKKIERAEQTVTPWKILPKLLKKFLQSNTIDKKDIEICCSLLTKFIVPRKNHRLSEIL